MNDPLQRIERHLESAFAFLFALFLLSCLAALVFAALTCPFNP